jgi:hypothetical protein
MKPITPQHAIDILVLETLEVQYSPTWDGANWVINPADVWLVCEGHVGSGGNEVDKIAHKFKASDLPAAGKTAMNALYNHLETKMAALYP